MPLRDLEFQSKEYGACGWYPMVENERLMQKLKVRGVVRRQMTGLPRLRRGRGISAG